ncbi:MAG TPA: hypothetical protein VN943_15060 [Candidatus Acidoferrum sp.]|nr:hypothetical protein [Candidatus Acidoferrum sp.]
MKEQFEQIRKLLDEIESGSASASESEIGRDFSALELPTIIREIVDDLQPLLSPYEAAFTGMLSGTQSQRTETQT